MTISPFQNLRKLGPKKTDHFSIGMQCPACEKNLVAGDYTALIALGPGEDSVAQAKARAGRAYDAVAAEVHWKCATGRSP